MRGGAGRDSAAAETTALSDHGTRVRQADLTGLQQLDRAPGVDDGSSGGRWDPECGHDGADTTHDCSYGNIQVTA